MKNLTRLATQIFGTPLAIQPQKLEAILAAIGPRIGIQLNESLEAAGRSVEPMNRKAYEVSSDGIACIPVQGTLMKKAYGLWALSGATSYESIGEQVEDAITDPSVRGILLDIDSPGGSTHGCFELSDLIYSLRGDKPIFAVANDSALSAAYAIASAADRVFVTRTGAVGSIGVFALHVDQSKADKEAGLAYTYVYAGDKKVDGNPHEPLSRTAKSDCQDEVDREYEIFVSTVARNRGAKADEIRKTQAASIFADNAISLLADEVGTCETALAALTKKLSFGAFGTLAEAPTAAIETQLQGEQPETGSTAAIAAEGATMPDLKTAIAGEAEDKKVAKAGETDDYMDDKKKSKKAASEEDSESDVERKREEEDGEDAKKAAKAARIGIDAVQIANLCTLAGKPEKAAEYLTKGFSAVKVQQMLLDERATQSEQHAVGSHVGPVSADAFDSLEKQATAIANSRGITKAKAYEELLSTAGGKQLYAGYRREKRVATSNELLSEKYLAVLSERLAVNQ